MIKFITAIINYFSNLRLIDVLVYVITVCILAGVIYLFSSRNKQLANELDTANTNNAAYQLRIEGQQSQIIQFELTTEYLRHCNDSVSVKLMETMDKLNISEKKLKQANYLLSNFKKTDTVHVTDTIFKEPDFALDTVIGDKWVSTRLELSYPSTIVVTPTVTSEKEVFIYNSKEFVGKRSKCFFIRWFQKKRTVTRVEVNEENPYIINQQNVFIKTDD